MLFQSQLVFSLAVIGFFVTVGARDSLQLSHVKKQHHERTKRGEDVSVHHPRPRQLADILNLAPLLDPLLGGSSSSASSSSASESSSSSSIASSASQSASASESTQSVSSSSAVSSSSSDSSSSSETNRSSSVPSTSAVASSTSDSTSASSPTSTPVQSSSRSESSSSSTQEESSSSSSQASISSEAASSSDASSSSATGGLPTISLPTISLPTISLPTILPTSAESSSTEAPSSTPSDSASSSSSGPTISVPTILPSSAGPESSSSEVTSSTPTDSGSASSSGPIITIPTISLPTISVPTILPSSSDGSSTESPTPSDSASSTSGPTISVPTILPSSSAQESSSTEDASSSPTDTGASSGPTISVPTSVSLPTILPSPSDSSSTTSDATTSDQPTITLPVPSSSSTSGTGASSVTSAPSSSTGSPTISIPGQSSDLISSTTDSQLPSGVSTVSGSISSLSSTASVDTSGIFSSGSVSVTPSSVSTVAPPSTTSLNSAFSFLTESSLLVASMSSTSASVTQSDPDMPASTVSGGSAAPTPTIPSSLPNMILPNPPLNTSRSNLEGTTLISMLYRPELNYPFMVGSSQTQGQVWAYMPIAIANALSIDASQIKAYAMQPYQSTSDSKGSGLWRTVYNAYIPSDQVDPLIALMSTTASRFWTASDGIAGQLANFTVPAFPLLYETDPNSSSSGGSGSTNNGSAVTVNPGNARRNAIIAVCSVIGGIGLVVLGWWIWISRKRSREAGHHRLSGVPSDVIGGGDGRGFGGRYGAMGQTMQERPPSVGPDGVRRNSFYFAEDSLRGYRDHIRDAHEDMNILQASNQAGPSRQRNLEATRISPPMLRENTLNW